MLTRNVHLMKQFPLVLAFSTILLAVPAGRLCAAPPEPVDGVRTAEGEAPAHSPLGDIMQVGAKLLGKSPAAENANKNVLPDVNAKGTSSSAARKAAIAELPLDQLTPEHRHQVNSLLKSVSFYRRLPKVSFPVEPDVYQYFAAHPDTAVSIWRAMKISKLQMWQTGRYNYEADTGDGSVGTVEVLHMGAEKSLVTCDGVYKTALFTKPIEAKSLLFVHTSFSRDEEGVVHVTHRADLFVSFPSQTIDVVSRIFSPLTVSMTDRTFTEISLFLKMISTAMARRPDWVEQIAEKMDGVPDIRKTQVLELNAQVHTATQKRIAETARSEPGQPGRNESYGQIPANAPDRRSPSREPGEKPGAARVFSVDRPVERR